MGVVARVGACIGIAAALVFGLLAGTMPAAAQSALLDPTSSRVLLSRDGTRDEVSDERVVRSGDTIATDQTGRAVITYPDGSTAMLEESSEITIEFVRTTAGDYIVRMQQTLGRVWYAVSRTVASGGRYEVRSAAMASVIRAGSGSLVTVSDSGTTVVAVGGTVDASSGGETVAVPAGSSTTASSPNDPPATPTSTSVTVGTAPTNAPAPTPAPTAAPSQSTPSGGLAVTTSAPRVPSATAAPSVAVPSAIASALPTKDPFGPRKDAPGQPVLPPPGSPTKTK